MLFAIHARFKAGVEERRAALRPAFNDHLMQRTLRIHLGGPLRDEEGAITGVLIIMEAPDLGSAKRFVESSPYTKAGLYEAVHIDAFEAEAGVV